MKNTRLVRCSYFFMPRLHHPTAQSPRGGDPGRRGGRLDGETPTRERKLIAVKTAMEERPCQ